MSSRPAIFQYGCGLEPMSDTSSTTSGEADRRDSAYSLQGLESLEIEPLIHDPEWQRNNYDTCPGLQLQAVASQYRFPQGAESVPRTRPKASLTGTLSSMAVSLHSRPGGSLVGASVRSGCPPSLDSGPTILTTQTSSLSAFAEAVARAGPIDDDGFLPLLFIRCDWDSLGCEKELPDAETWHEHSKSHFRGRGLPTCARCPFVTCPWEVHSADGEDAWDERRAHIEERHDLAAEPQHAWKRPDRSLIQHLSNKRIITDIQVQELRKSGRIGSSPEVYTSSHGPRDERRREGRPRNRRPGMGAH